MKTLPWRISLSTAVFVAFAAVVVLLFFQPKAVYSAPNTPITGWMWSDNIGWISMNCTNTSSCGTSNYGMVIDAAGNITGYAWSDNIGWISANPSDLTGCPSGTCTATIDPTTGAFSGWFRELAGKSAQAGATDGWISLSGASPAYGPVNSNTGAVSGMAWGSNSIGWVDFSLVTSAFTSCNRNTSICKDANTLRYIDNSCIYHDTTCPYASYGYGCVANACTSPASPVPSNGISAISVNPSLIHTGAAVKVSWAVSNVTASTCTVSGSNGDGASWGGLASSPAGGETSSVITARTTYTLTCQGLVPSMSYTSSATVSLAPDFQEK